MSQRICLKEYPRENHGWKKIICPVFKLNFVANDSNGVEESCAEDLPKEEHRGSLRKLRILYRLFAGYNRNRNVRSYCFEDPTRKFGNGGFLGYSVRIKIA